MPVPASSSEYSALSLFSGCGGFCEGARLAGFSVRVAVEKDRYAAETYRQNFPEVSLFEDTVEAFLVPADRRWAAERERFPSVQDGTLDLLFGGPPCQGFSSIGTRDLKDPRNKLYGEFVRILYKTQPRAFVMENVPNMLTLAKGRFGKEALKALRAAGYSNAEVRVLHASEFGVPQHRKRAVFFGTRDDISLPMPAGKWIEQVTAMERRPETTVLQAIGDLPQTVSADDGPLRYPRLRSSNDIRSEMRLDTDGSYYSAEEKLAQAGGEERLFNHHTKGIQEKRQLLIAQLKPGARGDSLPPAVWNGTRPHKWRRLHPRRPAYTLTAQMHRDLSEWVHPRHERWITVREAARLQSFHDGFIFKTSEWQMLKQVGNAVPPLLGRAMAMVALRALELADGEVSQSDIVGTSIIPEALAA